MRTLPRQGPGKRLNLLAPDDIAELIRVADRFNRVVNVLLPAVLGKTPAADESRIENLESSR